MNRLRILETHVLHASGVMFWLDGTSGGTDDHRRLAVPMELEWTRRPRDLGVINAPGRTAFWRRSAEALVEGEATDPQKALPAEPGFRLEGQASDPAGRYNPRRFDLIAGNGSRHGLVLYPTPRGTPFGVTGGLTGTLRRALDESPVAYALLELRVTLLGGAILEFRAQSNAFGDFRLALTRLPPLPAGAASYSAQLRVRVPATAAFPPDLDAAGQLTAAAIGSADAATQVLDLDLDLVPGKIQPIRSFARTFLSIHSI